MATTCGGDADCPPAMLCYAGVAWFEADAALRAAAPDGCLCNTFYGWRPFPRCDQLSRSSKITMGWNAVNLLLCLGAMAWLAAVAKRFQRQGKLLHISNVTVTLALGLAAAASAAVWSLVLVLSTAARDGPGPGTTFPDQYKGKHNSVLYIFAPLSIACSAFALLHIAVTWLQIAQATNRFSTKGLRRMRILVYMFEAAALALGVIGVVYERMSGTSIMGFVLSPLILCVLAAYGFGAAQLTRILHASGSIAEERRTTHVSSTRASDAATEAGTEVSSSRASRASQASPGSLFSTLRRSPKSRDRPAVPRPVFQGVITKVRNTTVTVGLCVLLFWVATLGISATDVTRGWKATTRPETFSAVKAFHHLQMTAIALGSITLAWYFSASGRAGVGPATSARRQNARRGNANHAAAQLAAPAGAAAATTQQAPPTQPTPLSDFVAPTEAPVDSTEAPPGATLGLAARIGKAFRYGASSPRPNRRGSAASMPSAARTNHTELGWLPSRHNSSRRLVSRPLSASTEEGETLGSESAQEPERRHPKPPLPREDSDLSVT